MTNAQLHVKQDKLKSTLNMIVQLCVSHLQSQSELLCQKTLFR